MPLELGVWRIDNGLSRLQVGQMAEEERLEDILQHDIVVASPDWLVIGRQVATAYGSAVDLLAMDRDGCLVVLELKRDKTPREVVAQLLDYGSWVKNLKDDDIASIFEGYLKKHHPHQVKVSLDEAFCKRFQVQQMPETLNESHQLVVVASALDPSTERIVSYLSDLYGVPINAVFFRVYKDEDREYLTRAWFIEPTGAEAKADANIGAEAWNGEYYVSFGQSDRRNWERAREYGFVSAGGGAWYSNTLHQLEPPARIWVNVPGKGYVGVGEVAGTATRVDQFKVVKPDGTEIPITELPVDAPKMFDNMDNDEAAEYLVPVKWIKTVPLQEAIKEKGFFGNQNTVCKPTTKKWTHTLERLKVRFGVP